MSAASSPYACGPADRVSARRDFALAALAAALAMIVSASTLLANPSFFLTDDYLSYFRPGFHEIARLIVRGQFPLLTDRLWNGGDLLQEYQYAVFNPVCLLLYAMISQIGDISTGAAIYSLTHIAILAAGVYALCRALGCLPRHAFLAGAVAPLSDWIFFWGAIDWIPALVSLAWLAWAWALLILTWRRRAFTPAAALAVALTLLSGWPFADFALLISALVAVRVLFVGGVGGRMRQAAWPALALVAGGFLAMPALLPLEFYAAFARRPAIDGRWAADLTGLLEIGIPLVQVRWGSFGASEFEVVRQPIVYAAWFAPLVLAGANWRTLASDRRVWIVLGSALAFAALSMISHIGLLRWMFRLLPYYQLALIVAAAIALTKADQEGTAWSFDRLALAIAIETWLAFAQTRSLALTYLEFAYAVGILAWLSTRFGIRRGPRWTAMALAASIGVFALTVWNLAKDGYPTYPQSWRPAARALASIQADTSGPERLYLVSRPTGRQDPGRGFWSTYPILNTSLYGTGATIVGYSALLSPSYARLQCMDHGVHGCDNALTAALSPVAPTQRSLLDLMGVGEVDIQWPSDAAAFAAHAVSGWTQSPLPGGGERFERPSREGQVTWASEGAAGVTRQAGISRIVIDARNDAATPGKLVVARAWYPAWHASLDGAPLRVEPLDDVLVAVDLPPKSRGQLIVSFWPAGLTTGLLLAALGALLVGAGVLAPTRLEGLALQMEGLLIRRGPAKISTA